MAQRARARARHASRPLRHRATRAVVMCAAAIVGFAGVGAYAAANLLVSHETADVSVLLAPTSDTDTGGETVTPTDFAAGEPVNIALIGSDERNGENGDIGGVVSGMRSDVTMVMHISADRERIEVVSIPRDLRVRFADCQYFDGTTQTGWTAKFNAAFATGGKNGDRAEAVACTMRSITELWDVEFNGHFMMVDFAGFRNMIDAIDGVPMCIPHDMSSEDADLDLEAGPQVFDGTTALAFARARTGTGLGDGTDLMRIERQQELLTNTARKVLGMNLLTDITKLTGFARAGSDSLMTDPQLGDLQSLIGLAYSLRNFETSNLTLTTVPWQYAGDGSGDVVEREAESDAMWARLVADEPILGEEEPEAEPSVTPSAEPSAEPSETSTPDTTATPDSSPSAGPTQDASTPEPSVSPSPLRETQQEILDACTV